MRAKLKQPRIEPIGTIVAVEIIADAAGYLLVGIGSAGSSIADTWHPTIAEAKAQAAFQYGVDGSEWR